MHYKHLDYPDSPARCPVSERTRKFAEELNRLIVQGERLEIAIQYECNPTGLRSQLLTTIGGDEEKATKLLAGLPSFQSSYQSWYSEATAVVKQVLPDRLQDFKAYYEYPKTRKDITYQNYMIKDYLQGLRVTRAGEVLVDGSAAIPEFRQQLFILKAAREILHSTLMNLKTVLQADLFDTEIESAQALAKAGYLRAAGAICGVVIEKHIRHVCNSHNIRLRKKNPGISDLNQALRDAEVTSVQQWRFIQYLADIRNLCDHAKKREPETAEINELVRGSGIVLKTVI